MNCTASKWVCDYIQAHVDACGHILGVSKIDIIYPGECTLHSTDILYRRFSFNSKYFKVRALSNRHGINWHCNIDLVSGIVRPKGTFPWAFRRSKTGRSRHMP